MRQALAAATRRSIAAVLAGVLLSLLASVFALGQIAGPVPSPAGVGGPAPLSHLYWNFLRAVVTNDRAADQIASLGQQAERRRNFLKQQLGFTDEEFAPIRATAQRLQAELKDQTAQAKAFIDARNNSERPFFPKTEAQLQALADERDAALAKEVAALRHALGPSAADRLDVYIQTQIRPAVLTHLPQPAPAPDRDAQKVMLTKYALFFDQVHANDVTAAKMERNGKDGSWLFKEDQNALVFNDAEFALVRQSARRWWELIEESLARRNAIVSAGLDGPVPPEIRALTQEREDIIQSEVSNLQKALGPDLSARLDAYVRSHPRTVP